jgi:hypothetical protein
MHQRAECFADLPVIYNALLRDANGGDAGDVRLNLAHLGGIHLAESG